MSQRVYVLGNGGHDYSDALRFGELVHIDIPHRAKWDLSQLYDILHKELEDATEEDYLVISNLTSTCCIASGFFVEWFGKVNFLIYQNNKYEKHTVMFGDLT